MHFGRIVIGSYHNSVRVTLFGWCQLRTGTIRNCVQIYATSTRGGRYRVRMWLNSWPLEKIPRKFCWSRTCRDMHDKWQANNILNSIIWNSNKFSANRTCMIECDWCWFDENDHRTATYVQYRTYRQSVIKQSSPRVPGYNVISHSHYWHDATYSRTRTSTTFKNHCEWSLSTSVPSIFVLAANSDWLCCNQNASHHSSNATPWSTPSVIQHAHADKSHRPQESVATRFREWRTPSHMVIGFSPILACHIRTRLHLWLDEFNCLHRAAQELHRLFLPRINVASGQPEPCWRVIMGLKTKCLALRFHHHGGHARFKFS
jgi:hypothetical protein